MKRRFIADALIALTAFACGRRETARTPVQPQRVLPALSQKADPPPSPFVHPLWRAPGKDVHDAVRDPAVHAIPLETPPPAYPAAALKARISGIVILDLIVDRSGRVSGGEVLKPLPFGLTEAAIAAVKQWRYRPARDKEGYPVVSRVGTTIKFEPPATR